MKGYDCHLQAIAEQATIVLSSSFRHPLQSGQITNLASMGMKKRASNRQRFNGGHEVFGDNSYCITISAPEPWQ